jgi:hypothetical protein
MPRKETMKVTVKLCVYCKKNPVPSLKNGLQSTWIDNCDECSEKMAGRPVQKRGLKPGQKINRNKSYRVLIMGGVDELTGESRVLYDEEFKQFEREALRTAKQMLVKMAGLYATVILLDRSTDKQIVVARFEWKSVMKVSNLTTQHELKTQLGDG